MKHRTNTTLYIAGFFITLVSVVLFGATVRAQINEEINYQGKLLDTTGSAVEDDDYNMRFRLYTTETGGSAIWTETLTTTNRVDVISGLFSTMLGSTTDFTGVDFDQTLWLGVEIGGTTTSPVWDGEMTPRKRIGAVPAAIEARNAQTLDGIATSSFLRSDASDTISANEASTLLSIDQLGSGDIVNIFDGGSEVFTVIDGGNVGIGTSSPWAKLSILQTSGGGEPLFVVATSTAGAGTTTLFQIGAQGTTTAANGVNIATGCFSIAGTCLDLSGGVAILNDLTDVSAVGALGNFLYHNGTNWTNIASSSFNIAISDLTGTSDDLSEGATNLFSQWTNVTGGINYASGRVGVGTSTPYGFLSVTNTTANPSFVVQDVANDTTPFVIGANGRVGISSDDTTPTVLLQVGSSSPSQITAANYYNSGYISGDFEVEGTLFLGSSGVIDAGFTQGSVLFAGTTGDIVEDNTNFFFDNTNDRFGVGTGTPSASLSVRNVGLGHTVYIEDVAGDSSPFVITNTGEIGIGTTNPNSILDIVSSGNVEIGLDSNQSALITLDRGFNGEDAYVRFQSANVDDWYTGVPTQNAGLSGDEYYIGRSSNLGSTPPAFVIDGNEYVGIGTSTPFHKLSVAGNVFATNLIGTGTLQLLGTGTSTNAGNLDLVGDVNADQLFVTSTNGSSTFAYSINLTGGCYAINDQCIGDLDDISNDLLGTLSDVSIVGASYGDLLMYDGANWVDRATSSLGLAESQWTTNGSNIYYNTGFVGIGTTSPYERLSVAGNIRGNIVTATTSFNTLLGATGEDVVQVDGSSFFRASTSLENIYIGLNAGGSYASGTVAGDVNAENVGIGQNALSSNTTGYNNTAIGKWSLEDNTEGYSNAAIGGYTLPNNTTGFRNTAVGPGALFQNTTGDSNTALGVNALYGNISGINNTAVGLSSLTANTTGGENVAVGRNALVLSTTGSNNTAVGYQASYFNTSATNTTALGYRAGYGNSGVYSAENNIFIGYGAADDITSGADNNIVIGYDVDLPDNAGSNQLNIGNLIFGTGIDGQDQTLSSGSIGIGTSSPYTKLSVAGEVVASAFHATNTSATSTFTGITSSCFSYDGTNCLSAGAGATTFAGLSDTPGSITANQLYFGNSGGSALVGSPSLTFNGTTLQAPTITATSTFNAVSDNGTTSIITLDGGSLLRASSTQSNTYLGIRAGGDSTSGDGVADNNKNNTAVGYEALMSNTTGYRNTALGNAALDDNTTGFWNTGLGNGALTDNTEGFANTSIGMASLLNNTTGDNNVAVGMHALFVSVTGNNNTALGHAALRNNTSATNSVAIGYQAGEGSASHTAQNNIFLGYQAGDSITSGADNNIVIGYDVDLPDNAASNQLNIGNLIFGTGIDGTDQNLSSGSVGIGTSSPYAKLSVAGDIVAETFNATNSASILELNGSTVLTASSTGNNLAVGLNAGQSHTNGTNNTAIGIQALQNATSSSNNTAVGYRALEDAEEGADENTAIGSLAMVANTTGDSNTAIGRLVLAVNTTGSDNTAIGRNAMRLNVSGNSNVAMGTFALDDSVTGSLNVAIGDDAIGNNISATNTTALGYRAGRGAVGSNNQNGVFIGNEAGANLTTGDNNIFLGYQAGDAVTSGSNNIVIGYDIDAPSNTASNQLNIGNLIFGTGIDGNDTTLSSGSIGIGTTSPTQKLTVAGNGLFGSQTIGFGFLDEHLQIIGDSLTDNTGIVIGNNDGTQNSRVLIYTDTANRDFIFNTTYGSAGELDYRFRHVDQELMTIQHTGEMIVGSTTAAAGERLTVVGGVYAETFNATNSDSMMELNGDTMFRASSTLQNIYIGLNAGGTYASGTTVGDVNSENVGIGQNVFTQNTTGHNNVAMGVHSMEDNTTGYQNAAYGAYSMANNTTGSNNTAIGLSSMLINTTGSTNTGVGALSLFVNTTGSANTAIGNTALRNSVTGNNNVAIGYESLRDNISATNTVAIGHQAGLGASSYSAQNNIFLGYRAGDDITSGADNNIVIGYEVDLPDNTASNQLNIGNLIFGTGIDGTDQNLSSGNIGIGTTSPYAKLSVAGQVVADSFHATNTAATSTFAGITSSCFSYDGTNCLSAGAGATTFTGLSDTPGSYTTNAIPYENGGALNFSAGFTFDGNYLNGPTYNVATTATSTLFTFGNNTFIYASSSLRNVGFGEFAMATSALITGTSNVAVGTFALSDNTSGNNNTAVGDEALAFNISGNENAAFGSGALFNHLTGDSNTAIGFTALYTSTSSEANTAIGAFALTENTTGNENTAVGVSALADNTTGFGNNAFGVGALLFNTTGDSNSAFGRTSLRNNTTGSDNVAVGRNALYDNKTGSRNVVMGRSALLNNLSATNTVAIGFEAGDGASDYNAENNIFIGYRAADAVTTGADNNIVIGYDIDLPNNAASNQLNIGNLIYGTGIDGTGTTNSSGNVGIGTSSPFAKLSVAGDMVAETFNATNSASLLELNGAVMFNASTTGSNTGVGQRTLEDITSGTANTALGFFTLANNTSGSFNTGLGRLVMFDNTTGQQNTAVGNQSMTNNVDGDFNVALGYQTLRDNIDGDNNTALGYQALLQATSATQNTAIGSAAMLDNTTGNANTAVGRLALADNTTGFRNNAFGGSALRFNITGSDNVAIGNSTLLNNLSATNTVAIGYSAGEGIGSYNAENNIFIGYNAADGITTGANNNIVIGYDVDLPDNTASNQLNIGNLIYGTGIDGTGTTNSSGNVGIGTSSPYAKLAVAGDVVASAFHATNTAATSTFTGITANCFSYDGTNCLNAGAGATTFAGLSDTPGSITANRLYFGNSGGTALEDSTSLTFNGSILGAPTFNATNSDSIMELNGTTILHSSSTLNNVALGTNAMVSITTGASNFAMGTGAMRDNETGSNNVALGRNAMLRSVSGGSNMAIGTFALDSSTTGSENVAIGYNALGDNNSATSTVAIGYRAGRGGSGAAFGDSVFIGSESGLGITTGDNNTFIGYQAGNSVTTGSNNIILGYDLDLPDNTGSNQLTIGNLIFGTGIDGTGQTLSVGNVGIGTSTPDDWLNEELVIQESGASSDTMIGLSNDGNAYKIGIDSGQNYNFEVQDSDSNPFFSITTSGHVGIGTTSPFAKLSVTAEADGSIPAFMVADSSNVNLFEILGNGTTTSTSTFSNNVVIDGGKFEHDVERGVTSITNLDLGPMKFEEDAGWVSWIDLPVSSGASAGTVEAYTAHVDNLELLTVYAEANGGGGVENTRIVVGTTSATVLSSTNIPNGSLIINDGVICVDDGGDNCDDAQRFAGGIYATSTAVTAIDLAENYPTLDATLAAGEIAMLDQDNAVFIERYDPAADDPVAVGIISSNPGVLLGGFGNNGFSSTTLRVPLALAGRVPVKVTTEGGRIEIGDRITMSSTNAGVGMRATTSGQTVGIALEAFDATSTEVVGDVVVYVQLEHYLEKDQFTILPNGNVGIGTTTPNYHLTVDGDVAGTAFINLSSEVYKEDIDHISATQTEALLDVARDIDIATYNYTFEEENAPKRLGVIAEESPSEILSASGEGVDLYKLGMVTLASVQELASTTDDLTVRLEALEAAVGVTFAQESGMNDSFLDTMMDFFDTMGVRVRDGMTWIANLTATKLTVGSPEKPVGITMFDEVTGDPFCVRVRNGNLNTTSGTCDATQDQNTEQETTPGETSTPADTPTEQTPPTQNDTPASEEQTQVSTSTASSTPTDGSIGTTPTVTVNGDTTVSLLVGDEYSEKGASAEDAEDGPLAYTILVNQVAVSEVALETGSEATFTITYQATDSDGNIATVDRTVFVVASDTSGTTASSTLAEDEGVVENEVSDNDTTAADEEENVIEDTEESEPSEEASEPVADTLEATEESESEVEAEETPEETTIEETTTDSPEETT